MLVPATVELAEELAPNLRPGDVAEAYALGLHPRTALIESVEKSELAYACYLGGELSCMFGGTTFRQMPKTPATPLGRAGLVWILTGHAVERHPRAFLRASQRVLQALLSQWDELTNIVDSRYDASLRWISWLGFKIEEPRVLPGMTVPFCRCTIRRS